MIIDMLQRKEHFTEPFYNWAPHFACVPEIQVQVDSAT